MAPSLNSSGNLARIGGPQLAERLFELVSSGRADEKSARAFERWASGHHGCEIVVDEHGVLVRWRPLPSEVREARGANLAEMLEAIGPHDPARVVSA